VTPTNKWVKHHPISHTAFIALYRKLQNTYIEGETFNRKLKTTGKCLQNIIAISYRDALKRSSQ